MEYQVSEDDATQIRRAVNKLKNVQFVGMTGVNNPDSLVIGPPFAQQPPPPQSSGSAMVAMRIIAAATASGVYTVEVPTTAPNARNVTTNLALPDDGETLPSAFNGYFENLAESGTTNSHYIPVGSWVDGHPALLSTDSPPMPIYRGRVENGALPPGGLQYQLLQRGDTGNTDPTHPPLGGGATLWDWARAHSAT